MSRYDDTQDIINGMDRRLEDFLTAHWPQWIPDGRRTKALLTPKVKDKAKKPTSSFTVDLTGANRGRWYRHSQKIGGHTVALAYYAQFERLPIGKEDWAEAYDLCRQFLGMRRQTELSPEERAHREAEAKVAREKREREQEAARRRDEAKRAARATTAAGIWAEGLPLAGSQAEAYLVGRGIPPVSAWPWDPHGTIRFHPSLEYELDKELGDFPALIANVQDAFGETVGIWRIFLDRKAAKKAPVDNPKVGMGPCSGGAVRIGGDGPRIGAGEGVESMLSFWVMHAYRRPMWSMLSTSGLMSFEPPLFVEHVDIFPDGDLGRSDKQGRIHEPPGLTAAKRSAERLRPAGVKVVINEPAIYGDGNEMLTAWGDDL